MKSKSTNLARGVFAWFCFMLVVFSLIFTAIYGLSVFPRTAARSSTG